ncbi:MAG: GH92 family glycosyl hydrolase [Alistipes sp.]|nr:GH92 family glycosyl hydrolase [Alistipes sp.]
MKALKRLLMMAAASVVSLTAFAQTPAQYVDTTIGTDLKGFESGYCVPGATRPFGMLQFTTPIVNKEVGFVINQVNAGCSHMGNFPMLAMKGSLNASPGRMMGGKVRITEEKGHAGYYAAKVDGDIAVEMTATCRTGLARLTFPATSEQNTVIIGGGVSASEIDEAAVVVTSPRSCEGYADGGNFCGRATPYKIYFVAEFDTDATVTGVWNKERLSEGGRFSQGADSGVYFTFDNTGKPLHYKIGISYVSVENARENLEVENSEWSFDSLRGEAEAEWNSYLGKIEVEGNEEHRKVQFYTHLYHVFMGPNIFSDCNGEYIGSDFEVHTAPQGREVYANFSNWDTYRTQIQLISMLTPDIASDVVVSHQLFAEQAGGAFPRWSMANIETGIMQGDPSTILVANAWAFGARGYDPKPLLEIMQRGATRPGLKCQEYEVRPKLRDYRDKGYTNASLHLEYTSADFALSRFALDACNDAFMQWDAEGRARSWKNLYNPATGWIQCKDEQGEWRAFSGSWEDYCEASYKTYFWMVPYNIKGLIDIVGGVEVAEARLDELTRQIDASPFEDWFPAGNEPGFHIPWIYNWMGKPAKASALINRILNELYHVATDGLPGNDDMGTMGAWYVFASVGMYPMIPGVGGFTLNTPIFEHITIHLPNGKDITISGGSEQKIYTQSLRLNGVEHDTAWVELKDLAGGATLEYKTSSKPSQWATQTIPPSYE